VFFGLFNDTINSLEPVVYGFAKESETLLNLTREMNVTERGELT